MSLIDNLIKVSVSISSGAESEASFNNILLVGAKPSKEDATVGNDVRLYTSTAEVLEAGWAASDKTYKAASIAFMNGAAELYIIVPKDEEEIEETLNRAVSTPGWYGLAVVEVEEDKYKDIAVWAEANNKLFAYTVDVSEKIEDVVPDTYNYALSFGTACIADNPDNEFLAIAALAKGMTYQPGSETWAYKTLSGIVADDFSSSQVSDLQKAGINHYVPCAGKNITLLGKVRSGEFIDVIRFRDWLVNDIQTRIYNLFIKNPKVPFTDSGIALIQNQMIASLKEGQAVGGIAETEYDEDGNEIVGYSTTVPLASSISDSNKASRTLAGCSFTARLAGAIHLVEIKGTLTT